MAGIYIHIPFCKSRCAYCDFFSTTMLEKRKEYVSALVQEAKNRVNENYDIQTIYFGGGTPSLLDTEDVQIVLDTLLHIGRHSTDTRPTLDKEITLEANPGDLTQEKLEELHKIGINRLSIGIQSFNDKQLRLIGRRHTADEAKKAVQMAQNAGFDNISIDLIYGLPNQTMHDWKSEIEEALQLNIQHISTYCLSYEEGTLLTRMLNQGRITATDEDTENEMYDYLVQTLVKNGFEHYEVSNFCKPGKHSQHNSSYWNGTPYIGLGAGAHSYDGQKTRRWNISDIDIYIQGITKNIPQFETETLNEIEQYNEQIMLGLRTRNGLQLSTFTEEQQKHICKTAETYLQKKQLVQIDDRIIATLNGIHILNRIIEDLMME